MAAKLTTIYWRDIPSQVIAKKRRETAKVVLPERFQKAIDRAAMRAGKLSSDAYLEDWRREAIECSDDLEAEAQKVAQQIELDYDDERITRLVRAHGLEKPRDDQNAAQQDSTDEQKED